MAAETSGALKLVYCAGLLIFGTMNTLTMKGQFMMTSVGSSGRPEQFSKPWFATFTVFFACTLVFINDFFLWVSSCCRKSKVASGNKPLLADESPDVNLATSSSAIVEQKSYWSKVLLVSIPAGIDVFATSFGCIGLVFVPASVFQMLKGSMIIFAALFSFFCLGRQLYGFNWMGVCLCVLGVTTVGLASICQEKPSSDPTASDSESVSTVAFGIVLIILGQVLQAAQMVLEEWLMKSVHLSGAHVIGWEGTWGCLLIAAIVFPAVQFLPGSDNGHVEDFVDTLTMLGNSATQKKHTHTNTHQHTPTHTNTPIAHTDTQTQHKTKAQNKTESTSATTTITPTTTTTTATTMTTNTSTTTTATVTFCSYRAKPLISF